MAVDPNKSWGVVKTPHDEMPHCVREGNLECLAKVLEGMVVAHPGYTSADLEDYWMSGWAALSRCISLGLITRTYGVRLAHLRLTDAGMTVLQRGV